MVRETTMTVKLSSAIMKLCWDKRKTPTIMCWEPFGCRGHGSPAPPCPLLRTAEVADPCRDTPAHFSSLPPLKIPILFPAKSHPPPRLVLTHTELCSFMCLNLAPTYNAKCSVKGQSIVFHLFLPTFPTARLHKDLRNNSKKSFDSQCKSVIL